MDGTEEGEAVFLTENWKCAGWVCIVLLKQQDGRIFTIHQVSIHKIAIHHWREKQERFPADDRRWMQRRWPQNWKLALK